MARVLGGGQSQLHPVCNRLGPAEYWASFGICLDMYDGCAWFDDFSYVQAAHKTRSVVQMDEQHGIGSVLLVPRWRDVDGSPCLDRAATAEQYVVGLRLATGVALDAWRYVGGAAVITAESGYWDHTQLLPSQYVHGGCGTRSAKTVCQADSGVVDLIGSGSAELMNKFVNLPNTRCTDRMALGYEATAGIDR